jgi:aminopeptidase YwaD
VISKSKRDPESWEAIIMRKKLFLFGWILLLLPFAVFSQKYQGNILGDDLISKIGGEVSGKICLEHIRDLSVFCRWYGSDDMEKAAQFIKAKAESYGLSEVRIDRFEVGEETYYGMQKPWHAWNCTSGELRLIEPRNELITSYEANSTCVLVNSRNTDIKAEVVYVEKGTRPEDYEGKDVKGKIVLAYGYPWDVSKTAIFEHGAAGVLIAWQMNIPGIESTEIYQTRICPWNEDKSMLSTFGFFLSTNQGKDLLALLQRGDKVVLQAKVQAEMRVPGFHQGVTATIPGSTYPDEEIIFTAHLDHPRPGAHDNNSGCAVLLETARAIKTLIDQGIIDQPKRTLRFYWTPHVWGADMLFHTYPDLFSKTIANINVDCVGLNQTKISSGFTVIRTPHSRASFIDSVLGNVLEYLILSNNNHMGALPYGSMMTDHDGSKNVFYGRSVPYLDYSDHIFFNSGSVGIPAVTLIDLPFGSHHSQNDELEFLDPTQLKRIAFLAAASSYYIASAGPMESPRIIDEVYYSGKVALEREMKLAKTILHDSEAPRLASDYRKAKNLIIHGFRREIRALESTRLIIKKNRKSGDYLERTLGRMKNFETECRADLQSLYRMKASGFDRIPEEPTLSAEDLKMKKIVPRFNPSLKGTFGILNIWPDDSYAFERYSPMYAFLYELLNLMNGDRNLFDIVNAVEAEALSSNYPRFSADEIFEFLELLRKEGIITY